MNITRQIVYNHFGALQLEGLFEFLQTMGDNNTECLTTLRKLIQQITNNVAYGYGKDHVWVVIRIYVADAEFDLPRWHVDGTFYKQDEPQSKFIITLKGSGTLFSPSSEEIREKFFKISDVYPIDEKDFAEKRKKRADLLKDKANDQAKTNEGVIFFVGDTKIAAIHSEPKINQPRIFLSILPGTKEQITELRTRWKK